MIKLTRSQKRILKSMAEGKRVVCRRGWGFVLPKAELIDPSTFADEELAVPDTEALERAGLVEQDDPCESVYCLVLTDKGRAVADAIA